MDQSDAHPLGKTTAASDAIKPPDQPAPEVICPMCNAAPDGRKLCVFLDGTSNKFGQHNTNVIELHGRVLDKKDKQLTYYSPGIGTYARPSWRAWAYWKLILSNLVDLAIAWNFEAQIIGAYRWLSNNFKDGDQIFLFGFSRGAYQVRALAGMIEKVGLLRPGNDAQVPHAYDLYADHESNRYVYRGDDGKLTPFDQAGLFKKEFSVPEVKVHFIGIWDTVSSVGIIRGKNLPLTDTSDHVCYFRHALALDELRVKFLPEYVCTGQSIQHQKDVEGKPVTRGTAASSRIKEVWFMGTHSDIGGGNKSNTELNNAAIPVLWMGNEAGMVGLRLAPSKVLWDWRKLKDTKPTKSLSAWWLPMEAFFIRRLSYFDGKSTTWWPHMAQGRIIKSGQKIHASVAFAEGYTPRARFFPGITDKTWKDIVGKGHSERTDWVGALEDLLEKDLFDHSAAKDIVSKIRVGDNLADLLGRLAFMALTHDGSQAIMNADDKLETIIQMLSMETRQIRVAACDILTKLFQFLVPEVSPPNVGTALAHMIDNDDVGEQISAAKALRSLLNRDIFDLINHGYTPVGRDITISLSRMTQSSDSIARVHGMEALWTMSEDGNLFNAYNADEEVPDFISAEDPDTRIECTWSPTLLSEPDNFPEAISSSEVTNAIHDMLTAKDHGIRCSGAYALLTLAQDDEISRMDSFASFIKQQGRSDQSYVSRVLSQFQP